MVTGSSCRGRPRCVACWRGHDQAAWKRAANLWRVNDRSDSAPHVENLDTTDPEVLTQRDPVESDVAGRVDSTGDQGDQGDGVSGFDPPPAPASELDGVTRSAGGTASESIDLDAIERDLTDVQTALERLDDGSYWTDEVTGAAIADDVLASFPLTRTVAGSAAI